MAMAKMAGDADSESGCDDKERVQRAASTWRPKGRGQGGAGGEIRRGVRVG